jgi:two-component system, OmpR family, phosphate regulon sensor histidine kinase PhoR
MLPYFFIGILVLIIIFLGWIYLRTIRRMAEGVLHLRELQDEFAFIAAHELRSPVTAIRGYLSLALRDSSVSGEAQKYLTEADKANQRLLQLVQDLLEAMRSETGKINIRVQPISIVEPIREVIDEVKSLAAEKSIVVTYEPPADTPQIQADTKRVKEIMVNLLSNAIKYTPQGGVIHIAHEVKKGMLATHVQDNGFGISRGAQKNLFKKFYRVQTDKTRDIQGTGLGLFIVKEIVERMDGKIWFTSEEGRGSTFSFSLPLA